MKKIALLINSELKVSFRNMESLIFTYIFPVALLLVLRLFFDQREPVLSSCIFLAIFFTGFFGISDWIVILRKDFILQKLKKFTVNDMDLWLVFFISRLIIVLFQAVFLLTAGLIVFGYFNFMTFLSYIFNSLFAGFFIILLGLPVTAFANEKNVRMICGMFTTMGLFLAGSFYLNKLLSLEAIFTWNSFGVLMKVLENSDISILHNMKYSLILVISLLILGILNLIYFKKIFTVSNNTFAGKD